MPLPLLNSVWGDIHETSAFGNATPGIYTASSLVNSRWDRRGQTPDRKMAAHAGIVMLPSLEVPVSAPYGTQLAPHTRGIAFLQPADAASFRNRPRTMAEAFADLKRAPAA